MVFIMYLGVLFSDGEKVIGIHSDPLTGTVKEYKTKEACESDIPRVVHEVNAAFDRARDTYIKREKLNPADVPTGEVIAAACEQVKSQSQKV